MSVMGSPIDAAAIEEAAFLVRSPHRLRLLEALAERPLSRSELTEAVTVSRVTLGRSLGAMADRNWIARDGDSYRLRPLGELVLDDVSRFLETMSTQTHLRGIVDLLPVADLDFDLRRLGNASIVLTTRHDAGAAMRRYLELVENASSIRVLKDTIEMAVVRTVSDRIADGDLDAAIVYTDAAIETTADIPEARELMARDLANGKDAFRYPDRLPHHLAIVDGTVVLFLLDDRGIQGLVETDDAVVREWARATFEAVRDEAERLDVTAF